MTQQAASAALRLRLISRHYQLPASVQSPFMLMIHQASVTRACMPPATNPNPHTTNPDIPHRTIPQYTHQCNQSTNSRTLGTSYPACNPVIENCNRLHLPLVQPHLQFLFVCLKQHPLPNHPQIAPPSIQLPSLSQRPCWQRMAAVLRHPLSDRTSPGTAAALLPHPAAP